MLYCSSLLGNRISGTIPTEIGDIATLEELILEDNMLVGALDPNLGNLSRLRRLLLSANNFTGTIPESFGNLKNLTDFRIDGSSLSGKIPEFIGNWTKLTRLDLQGTGMQGPIPSSISLLTNMTELRISDLGGSSSPFPNLQNVANIQYLVLRNCLITGSIPSFIGEVGAANLRLLDLSFNRLTGPIPPSFDNLDRLEFLYLTNNSLSGAVSNWELGFEFLILRKQLKLKVEGNEYVEDTSRGTASSFITFGEKWAYSSTGSYIGTDNLPSTVNNPFSLNVTDSELYQTARVVPNSLKYYGLCMMPGSYKVRLHFAEIQYSDDKTFSSLGRRYFDISIQGNEVLKNFNIMEAAGGVGMGIYRDFDNVTITGTTLEIHLYWAGKGTTAIPDRGVYGPLISAITVTPNFKVGGGGLSTGAIVGIVISSVAFVLLILLVLRLAGLLGRKEAEDP
ncbi:hypothetical protein CRG98_025318, partial [Punica granatum]